MLSFVPLALLLVAAFGLVFDDAEVRERVVKTVFENIPLSAEDDRERLEATVSDALERAGQHRPVLGAAADRGRQRRDGRAAPHHQRGVGHPRAPAAAAPQGARPRAVLGATIVLALSLAVTATRKAANVLDDEEGGGLARRAARPRRRRAPVRLHGRRDPVPLLRAARCTASARATSGRASSSPSLLLAILREGLELYFEHLADFGALYGSLGALMALLLFVYAAAMVLLFGAEFASEWTRLPGREETAKEVRALAGRLRLRRGA